MEKECQMTGLPVIVIPISKGKGGIKNCGMYGGVKLL